MGWGIYLYPEIYYSKVDYRTKEDVLNEIESVKKIIAMLERKLEGLAMMTEPAKMMSKEDIEEGISPMEWVRHEVFQILSEDYSSLKDYYYELFKLELLYDHWDAAHNENGKAVAPPKGSFKWPRVAYMGGDFVDAVYEELPIEKESEETIITLEEIELDKLSFNDKEEVLKGNLIWSEKERRFIINPNINENSIK
jgi:hypothetical protein